MNHVAWADDMQQILRLAGMCGVFHRIEVIQIAKEFIETVNAGQELIPVAKMILPELAGGIAHRLENRGRGYCFGWYANLGACLAYCAHACSNRKLTHDEGGATSRAACLGATVVAQPAFPG